MFENCVSLGEGGRNPKKPDETEKTSPKFEICYSLRFFSFFFGFFGLFRFFCGTFSVFSV